ncbi:uncharacterized protein LOC142496574 [Ascaphus truei]|uniref:uncharacterized protein LOC142496574 n=1 Tax=Ascaphus truei TaxID=8439 RepID=UPI003F5997BF
MRYLDIEGLWIRQDIRQGQKRIVERGGNLCFGVWQSSPILYILAPVSVVSPRASAVSSSASSVSSHASAVSSPLPIEEITPVLVASDSSSVASMSHSQKLTSRKHARGKQHNLSSQQQSEQRFFNSQKTRHQDMMAVQKEIVAELVNIKNILNRNSTAFDLHNSLLHSIDESLIKQNELQACAILSRRHDLGSSTFDRGLGIFPTPTSKHESPPLSSSPATSLPSFQTPLLAASPATLIVSSPAQLLAASPATLNASAQFVAASPATFKTSASATFVADSPATLNASAQFVAASPATLNASAQFVAASPATLNASAQFIAAFPATLNASAQFVAASPATMNASAQFVAASLQP